MNSSNLVSSLVKGLTLYSIITPFDAFEISCTVNAPNIALLSLLTSVGYNKKETNLKNCAQLNKVINLLYLHRVQNENIVPISSNFDLKCTTPLL